MNALAGLSTRSDDGPRNVLHSRDSALAQDEAPLPPGYDGELRLSARVELLRDEFDIIKAIPPRSATEAYGTLEARSRADSSHVELRIGSGRMIVSGVEYVHGDDQDATSCVLQQVRALQRLRPRSGLSWVEQFCGSTRLLGLPVLVVSPSHASLRELATQLPARSERSHLADRAVADGQQALQYIHKQCVYHRNVSPDSLRLSRDKSRIILCDFSIAISPDAAPEKIIALRGDPRYISPLVCCSQECCHMSASAVWRTRAAELISESVPPLATASSAMMRQSAFSEQTTVCAEEFADEGSSGSSAVTGPQQEKRSLLGEADLYSLALSVLEVAWEEEFPAAGSGWAWVRSLPGGEAHASGEILDDARVRQALENVLPWVSGTLLLDSH